MIQKIHLGDIAVDVVLKDIKNVHLSVYPPTGRVRISAPKRMSIETIRMFAISKLGWIKRQQLKLQQQERETPREYVERESHYVWGKRYLLSIAERNAPPSLALDHSRMLLSVRPGADTAKKQAVMEGWYRGQVRGAVPTLLDVWEPRLAVHAERVYVRRMKTRWGSCNCQAHTIRLNTELAKKPPECLEYVVVHELVHLLEPTHSARFYSLMDQFIPNWRVHRDVLNRLPVRREEWDY
jgi:predicted metal-dependent hydrolase